MDSGVPAERPSLRRIAVAALVALLSSLAVLAVIASIDPAPKWLAPSRLGHENEGMSHETFDRIQAAITLLLAVGFLWWVVALAQEMKKRFWYLPAGVVFGAVIGVIVGGYVCQPWTMLGGLFGVVSGAAVSSWKRSRQERLIKHLE